MRRTLQTGRLQISNVEVLANQWYTFTRYELMRDTADGSRLRFQREACSRADRALVLIYSHVRQTVVLIRQFRLPVWLNGDADGYLLEVPGGLVEEGSSPSQTARLEALQETGIALPSVQHVFSTYLSPQVLIEKTHCFIADRPEEAVVLPGVRCGDDGEETEVVELSFREALLKIDRGEITDCKTITLLLYVQSVGLLQSKR